MRNRGIKTIILASLVVLGLPSITMAGARTLYARMEKAAEVGCDLRPYSETGSIKLYNESRACYKKNLAAAVERINSDALTKIHNSK